MLNEGRTTPPKWLHYRVERRRASEEGYLLPKISLVMDFPCGAVVKNPPANAGGTGLTLAREDHTCRGATKPVRHNY